MERRSLAALAVAALFVSAVAWVLLSDSQGDDSYDRVARTWVDGEDPELAASARSDEAEAPVAEAAELDELSDERRSTDNELPTAVAPQVDSSGNITTYGIDFGPRGRGERDGRLSIGVVPPNGGTSLCAWATLSCSEGALAGTAHRLRLWGGPQSRGSRIRCSVHGLAGDVELVIELGDTAPIELRYADGEFSRSFEIDTNRSHISVVVEAAFDVADIFDGLASAAYLRGQSGPFELETPQDATMWLALGAGRASALRPLGVERFADHPTKRASFEVARLHLPRNAGGDTYTSGTTTIVVGRDWMIEGITPLGGWPLAFDVGHARSGLRTAPEGVTEAWRRAELELALGNDLDERAGALEFELEFPGDPPSDVDLVGYGWSASNSAVAHTRVTLPVVIDTGRSVARATFDPLMYAPPQRFMLRAAGCVPHFFDGRELFATPTRSVRFETGSGAVVLTRFRGSRDSRVDAAGGHDLLWNSKTVRADLLGFAEFAFPNEASLDATELLVVAPAWIDGYGSIHPEIAFIDSDRTELSPGVVECAIE
jgi:hypothetical protein